MPERDAAAVRVDVVQPLLEAGVVRELQHDRRERLVHLDDGDVVPVSARVGERLLARLRIAVQHPVRVDAREPNATKRARGLSPSCSMPAAPS